MKGNKGGRWGKKGKRCGDIKELQINIFLNKINNLKIPPPKNRKEKVEI